MLPPSSHFTLKMEAAWASESLVSLPQHCTGSQHPRPRLESSPPWQPKYSH